MIPGEDSLSMHAVSAPGIPSEIAEGRPRCLTGFRDRPRLIAPASIASITVIGFGGTVTIACERFERGAIIDRDPAARVSDHTVALQPSGGDRNALATHPEKHRESFMGHSQTGGLHPIGGNEEPTAQALLDRMQAVAHGGARKVDDKSVGIVQERGVEWAAFAVFVTEKPCGDVRRGAAPFDDGFPIRDSASQEK